MQTATRYAWPDDERFRMLVEGINDYAVFMLDAEGTVLTWNSGAERILQYRADEITGRHFSLFFPREDVLAGKCEHELEAAARDGRFEVEAWRVRKGGTPFWANVVITAIRDARGVLQGYAKVTRDLTERKSFEETLRLREQRLRLLIDSIQDYAIFMLDPDGKVASWNHGAATLSRYRDDEIIGRHFSTFYPREAVHAGDCERELQLASAIGRCEEERWLITKDGGRYWASVVINAIRDDNGALVGFAMVTRDLTERKRAEEERAARLAAEEANQAKDEFMAMLGHELRNPLAPIVTALQLAKLRGDASSAEHEIIERQVKHMVRLVDDLLDVSRITRGEITLRRQPLFLHRAIASAVETAGPLIEQRHHHFDIESPAQALRVDGDESRLAQVFTNLLTNAAKYTEPGGHIVLGLRAEGPSAVIEVSDDGAGIATGLLPRIFDLFVQGHQGAERAAGGLGIGLTLVRAIVTLHGGSVAAYSDGLGRGSRFEVRLPLLPADFNAVAAERNATPPRGLPLPRRILVVDDNADALVLIAEVLRTLGQVVLTAADAVEALAVAPGFGPDVAILDIGLPGMDGYELGARLRAELGERAPRLIALTGYGQPGDRSRSTRAGFSAHLVKPVDARQLLSAIEARDARAG